MTGVRVRWVDKHFVAHEHLIGLRHLNPSPELLNNASQYSELIYSWCVAVLSEFNTSVENDVFALVTDGGSGVKCCTTNAKFLAKKWECVFLFLVFVCGCFGGCWVYVCVRACVRQNGWINNSRPSHNTHNPRWCTPHALNRAIADALGYTLDGEKEEGGDEEKEGRGEEEKEGGGESNSDGGNAGAGAGVAGAAAAEGRRGRRRARASAGIRSGKQLLLEIRMIVKSIDRSLPQQVRCINMIE